MQDIESGSSEFLSWINGKGPWVPQPLPADAVPQVVVVNDWCHGLTNEMFEEENLESTISQFSARPSPLIAPINDLFPVLGDASPTLCRERRGPIVETPYTRLNDALAFRKHFTNRSNSVEKGTCIWSDGTHLWSDKSCGIMWVAVHGMHSICVVTRNEDLVREVRQCMRALDLWKEDFLEVFREGIIYKVEELADQMFDQSCKKPFGVVSVIPGTREGTGHEASGAEYDEEKAIKFLQDEMESNTAFTFDKTVQTAISAFQHLFGQKFKANELRVIVWKEDGDIVKELPSFDDRSIEEQVAAIRGHCLGFPLLSYSSFQTILKHDMIRSEGMLNRESVRSQYTFPLSAMEPYDIDGIMIASRHKSDREGDAESLPRLLTYGYNPMTALNQKNTCIWSGGTLSWTEALYGIMWVGVHGMDSICVVTRIKDLEQEITLRMAMFNESKPKEAEDLLRSFTNGLIGEVELGRRRISDFVDPSTKHRRFRELIIQKPFGVVSVIPDTKIVPNCHKALNAKYDEEKAIKFLQNEMESSAAFTPDKTVQTAICALDHLFGHEFKANEMAVFFWKSNGGGQAKALPHIREDLDIDEHLAVINKPYSCLVTESPEESVTRF